MLPNSQYRLHQSALQDGSTLMQQLQLQMLAPIQFQWLRVVVSLLILGVSITFLTGKPFQSVLQQSEGATAIGKSPVGWITQFLQGSSCLVKLRNYNTSGQFFWHCCFRFPHHNHDIRKEGITIRFRRIQRNQKAKDLPEAIVKKGDFYSCFLEVSCKYFFALLPKRVHI